MPPTCSICGRTSNNVGPLCLTECAWEKGRAWFECKTCALDGQTHREDLQGLIETLTDRTEHYAKCGFCYARKALLRPGPLAMACNENTKRKEAEARKAVA